MSYSVNQGQFIFDGVDSQDYGVYITGDNAYNAAKKRDEEVVIPGRNGTLTYNDADVFDDVELVYPAFIPRNYTENIRNLRNALSSKHGKKRLTDSYHPDEYMLAKYVDGLDADTAPRAVAGAFDIIFKRDPRRFLLTGETVLTDPATVTNPTLFAARPLIRVYGYGTLTVGDVTVTVAQNPYEYIDIDSEMMDCYHGDDNANSYVSFSDGEFPTLPAGTTALSYSGNITKVELTPHWWRL